MSKRGRNETTSSTKKKSCSVLRNEWLSETEIQSYKHRQTVKIADIFINRETHYVVCSICSEANALSEFTSGKK
jgi:hypothetical protein